MTTFLEAVPQQCYEEVLGELPNCQQVGTLAASFVTLAKKNPDMASRIITACVKNKIDLVKQGTLSLNTLPNYIKPIKALLDSNGVALHWKSLYKLYPRGNPAADDRTYTKGECKK